MNVVGARVNYTADYECGNRVNSTAEYARVNSTADYECGRCYLQFVVCLSMQITVANFDL